MTLRMSLIALFALLCAPLSFAQGFKPRAPWTWSCTPVPGAAATCSRERLPSWWKGEAAAGAPAGDQQARRNSAVAAAHLAEKRATEYARPLHGGVAANPLVSAEAKVTLRDLTPIARLVWSPR